MRRRRRGDSPRASTLRASSRARGTAPRHARRADNGRPNFCRWRAARRAPAAPRTARGRHCGELAARVLYPLPMLVDERGHFRRRVFRAARRARGYAAASSRSVRQRARRLSRTLSGRLCRLTGCAVVARFEKSELLRHRGEYEYQREPERNRLADAPLQSPIASSAALQRDPQFDGRLVLRHQQQRPLDEISRRANLAAIECISLRARSALRRDPNRDRRSTASRRRTPRRRPRASLPRLHSAPDRRCTSRSRAHASTSAIRGLSSSSSRASASACSLRRFVIRQTAHTRPRESMRRP